MKVNISWWLTAAVPALRRQDCEFRASLGYIVRLCLKRGRGGWVNMNFYLMRDSLKA
jgi:hypothetical protein